MDLIQSVVLALIQGITEFLPISSSAHLVLPTLLLGWKDQGLAFDTAVHFGSLIAVIIYFRIELLDLITHLLRRITQGIKTEQSAFAVNLLIASIPIVPVGFLARFFIEAEFRNLGTIAVTTLVFGIALLVADYFRRENHTTLTPGRALMIGFAQCLALIPGTSRSGVTITMALLLGYTREQAARISFLIAIPAIGGAASLKLADLVMQPVAVDWTNLTVGAITAGLSAYLCIALFLAAISRIGYLPFVIYRVLLSGLLILLIL